MKDRIDKILVEKGILKTRSQARMLITQGDIFCNGKQVKKPGLIVDLEDHFEIKERNLYVGRGAYKLEKAINEFSIAVKGKMAADFGASTGGFTQVLLEAGARKVYAVDVGTDQLSPVLRDDERVIDLSGRNIKYPLDLNEKVDIAVVDLSFISLRLVLKNIMNVLKAGGEAIILIKPQFEAGRDRLGKGGLVKDEQTRQEILDEVKAFILDEGHQIKALIESPIVGNKSGNVEYLAHILK